MIRPALSTLALLVAAPALAEGTVTLEFRGAVELPQDLTVDGQTFGGISGVAYDGERDLYYAVGDDLQNARFHALRIDLADGELDDGDVDVLSSVLMDDVDGEPFPGGSLDPEGIAIAEDGSLLIAAEPVGDVFPAFIRRYSLEGDHLAAIPLDDERYDPRFDAARGTRPSGGFETLQTSDNRSVIVAAFEKPLKQDMEDYDVMTPSPVRILNIDARTGETLSEMVYMVGTMTIAPEPADGGYGRGLNDLMLLGEGTALTVERQYAEGVTAGTGSRPVEIFQVFMDGATDVKDVDALTGAETPVRKELVLDLETLRTEHGLERIGSHEVLVLGPDLPDGSESLIMIEDNDFDRPTQVLLFALRR